MKDFKYKCVVSKNGSKMYYKRVNGKWKRISNKTGMNAEKGGRKYNVGLATSRYLTEKFPKIFLEKVCKNEEDSVSFEPIDLKNPFVMEDNGFCINKDTLIGMVKALKGKTVSSKLTNPLSRKELNLDKVKYYLKNDLIIIKGEEIWEIFEICKKCSAIIRSNDWNYCVNCGKKIIK